MRAIVIGAGFIGCAAAWQLSQRGFDVEVWDPRGIAGGASGAAAGMLHKYPGVRSRPLPEAKEAFSVAEELIAVAGKGTILQRGLLRYWQGSRQERAFRLLAKRYDDVHLREDGIWIPDAYALDCRRYCERLFAASGATLVKKRATTLDLPADRVVVAAGWESNQLPGLEKLPLQPVKGELIHLEAPQPLDHAIGANGYLVQGSSPGTWVVGTTFEHDNIDATPSDSGQQELLQKAERLWPGGSSLPVKGACAGIRAATPDHRPILIQLNEKVEAVCGVGSKGLFWHGWLARRLRI